MSGRSIHGLFWWHTNSLTLFIILSDPCPLCLCFLNIQILNSVKKEKVLKVNFYEIFNEFDLFFKRMTSTGNCVIEMHLIRLIFLQHCWGFFVCFTSGPHRLYYLTISYTKLQFSLQLLFLSIKIHAFKNKFNCANVSPFY